LATILGIGELINGFSEFRLHRNNVSPRFNSPRFLCISILFANSFLKERLFLFYCFVLYSFLFITFFLFSLFSLIFPPNFDPIFLQKLMCLMLHMKRVIKEGKRRRIAIIYHPVFVVVVISPSCILPRQLLFLSTVPELFLFMPRNPHITPL
jgi:hypothetical protein